MKSVLKDKKKIFIACVIMALITTLSTLIVKYVDKRQANLSPEILRSMGYTQVTDEDSKIKDENGNVVTDYVRFSAFFTNDLDNDGNAEKLLGTCKNVNSKDTLYIDLNVLTNGYLKNGVITINGTNFKYSMGMVQDDVLKNNYISDDVKTIELNQINAGTQKLILGEITSNIGNDTNNYSVDGQNGRINSITLTGTHVSDEGVSTTIEKTIDLTVDWYGEVNTEIYTYNQTVSIKEGMEKSILINASVDETVKSLLLKENNVKLTVPELNGYAPTEVVLVNEDATAEYTIDSKLFTIKKESMTAANGQITNKLAESNTYTIKVTYTDEAYVNVADGTVLTIPVEANYVAYNNANTEFENPITSNTATDEIKITFKNLEDTEKGYVYNFDVSIENKTYQEKSKHFVLLKQDLLNMYETGVPSDFEYIVKWDAVRGTKGDVSAFVMKETEAEQIIDEENTAYGDKFNSKVIDEYTVNKAIYFTNFEDALSDGGYIVVYDNDTGAVLKIFTKEEARKYSEENPYIYESEVKHVKVELSTVNTNQILSVHNIKKLNTEKIMQDFSKEDIEDVQVLYTYLTGTVKVVGEEEQTLSDIDSVYLVKNKSMAEISIEQQKISVQEEIINEKIFIKTVNNAQGDSDWKNAEFAIEMPEEIVGMAINSIKSDDSNVNITAFDLENVDGKYVLKIQTENQMPATYTLTVDCNITANSNITSATKEITLYAYNENCDCYYNNIEDKYDVNNNQINQELVGTSNTNIELEVPTKLITFETITEAGDNDEIVYAPNVATTENDSVKVNVNLINNYDSNVSDVVVMGKIPYADNTSIVNYEDLKSKLTTKMMNEGIILPEGLEDSEVYYSENEIVTKDLKDENNNWKTKEELQNLDNVKSYLIVINKELKSKENYVISYNIKAQDGTQLNLDGYSTHAVYYKLQTEEGLLEQTTEPSKVGVRFVKLYDLSLDTYKVFSDIQIKNVRYSLKWQQDGKQQSKTLNAGENGNIQLQGLLKEVQYTLVQTSTASGYVLNTQEVSFIVHEDNNVEIVGVIREQRYENGVLSLELENEVKYILNLYKKDEEDNSLSGVKFDIGTTDVNGKIGRQYYDLGVQGSVQELETLGGYYLNKDSDNTVKFNVVRNEETHRLEVQALTIGEGIYGTEAEIVENENSEDLPVLNLIVRNKPIEKYKLRIRKLNEDGEEIAKAKFMLTNEETEETIELENSEEENTVTFENLEEYIEGDCRKCTYRVQEIESPDGYGQKFEELNFYAYKDNNGELQLGIVRGEEFIRYDEEEKARAIYVDGDTITIDVVNYKGRGFKIRKVDADTGAPIAATLFDIYVRDENEEACYRKILTKVTDENGEIGLSLSDNDYKVVEIRSNPEYQLPRDEEDRTTYFTAHEDMGDVVITNKKSAFIVTKIDEANGERIPGVEFDLYKSEDETYQNITFMYSATTDENGEIRDILPDGYYKLVETKAADGYILEENQELRTKYLKIENEEKSDETAEETTDSDCKEIGCIEDLVKFSEEVNKGNPEYINATVKLTRTLDFEDSNSYKDPNSTLKSELTNKDGNGFTPIGVNTEQYFSGTFDGNGYEIRNLYINNFNKDYVGLFGYVDSGTIKKLGVTGTVTNSRGGNIHVGGIAGRIVNSDIINCYNMAHIISSCTTTYSCSNYVGGIAGYVNDSSNVVNCYNTGNINSISFSVNNYTSMSYAGGIAGYVNSSSNVSDCYNTGDVNSNSNSSIANYTSKSYAGGIAGYVNGSSNVINCYNTGNVNSNCDSNSFAGGIAGYVESGSISDCYNKGDVNSISSSSYSYSYAGGISAYVCNSSNISNCYNIGNISVVKGYVGGIAACISNSINISNCYNTGYISIVDGSAGGIVGYMFNSSNSITNCYNTGDISSIDSKAGGIVGYLSGNNSITNCYNTGYINSNNNSGASYEGGIVGYISGSNNIINCYYLDNMTKGAGYGNITATSKTQNEMKSLDFYNQLNNYDVTSSIWVYTKNSYPTLRMVSTTMHPIIINTKEKELNVETRTITKVDKDTNKPLANVRFSIYNTETNSLNYFSKDASGKWIKNASGTSTLQTDSNGQITLELPEGNYKAVETSALSGYILDNEPIYFSIGKANEADVEINSIEDLVDFAYNVNNGMKYAGKTIKLMKTLDFNEGSSYENEKVSSYNSMYPDGELKTLLTSGTGFIPIGDNNNYFAGTFDGNGYEIKNLYINGSYTYAGLFGYTKGATITNLGITGNSTINNTNITSSGYTSGNTGAIVAYAYSSIIANCYNTQDVSGGSYAGGIVGYGTRKTQLINCYNKGNIKGDGYAGGIIGKAEQYIYINKCFNEGKIEGKSFTGGISGEVFAYSIINNCYNKGSILANSSTASGISGSLDWQCMCANSYNIGNIFGGNAFGIANYTIRGTYIYNCYNSGNISGIGLAYGITDGYRTANCYNTGVIEGNNKSYETSIDSSRKNTYYLKRSTSNTDNDVEGSIEAVNYSDMISRNFVNLLNENKKAITMPSVVPYNTLLNMFDVTLANWIYQDGKYPTFDTQYYTTAREIVVENEKIGNYQTLVVSKVDENTNKPIPNTKYAVYETDELYNEISMAKDPGGNYWGTPTVINGKQLRVLTTDSYGKIYITEPVGYYKAIEVQAAPGYELPEDENDRIIYFKVENPESEKTSGEATEESSKEEILIRKIEDLVDLSENVKNGNSYAGQTIKLMNDLDFNDASCYRNANKTNYYENGSTKTIKEELTTGEGFRPIGPNPGAFFKGSFDGNGYEIKNLYINRNDYGVALFGAVEGARISNLGVYGDIRNTSCTCAASIAGQIVSSTISNCYSKVNFDVYAIHVGGIVGSAGNSKIIDCYNLSAMANHNSSGYLSGIAGYASGCSIVNCYNKGTLISVASGNSSYVGYVGGIAGNVASSNIINCYNKGNCKATTCGGIVNTASNSKISNCYNIGTMTSGPTPSPILFSNTDNSNTLSNCYYLMSVNYGSSGTPGEQEGFYRKDMRPEELAKKLNANRADIKSIAPLAKWKVTNSDEYPDLVLNEIVTVNKTPTFVTVTNRKLGNELIINKIDSKTSQGLAGATFKIEYVNIGSSPETYELYTTITTDSRGRATVDIPEGKRIRITEENAPAGYATSSEVITVTKDKYALEYTFKDEKLDSYVISKVDENNNPIQGTKFAIYKVNEYGENIEFAKNVYGQTIGTNIGTNGEDLYVVETDSMGKLNLLLPDGYYKAVEIQAADGYLMPEDEDERSKYFEVNDGFYKKFNILSNNKIEEINYIEDLVEISNNVRSGKRTYEGVTFKLMRDLDFERDDSYRNPNDTTIYEDSSARKTGQPIKSALTSGNGFFPIGFSSPEGLSFRGNFDGNNKMISGLYISYSHMYVGLFGYIKDSTIVNLKIDRAKLSIGGAYAGLIGLAENSNVRNIKILETSNFKNTGSQYYGSIISYATNCNIEGCCNYGTVTASGGAPGTLIGAANNTIIMNCENSGDVTITSPAGGIAYKLENGSIMKYCSNNGTLTATAPVAGIVCNCDSTSLVKDCYNSGTTSCSNGYIGGVVCFNYGKIINCYNTGTLTNTSSSPGFVGGVAFYNYGVITDCYNEGNINTTLPAGGICYTNNNTGTIINSYNKGMIKSSCASGISESNSGKIINCYNTGVMIAESSPVAGICFYNNSGALTQNCYSIGQLSGGAGNYGISYSNSGDIIDTYYLDTSATSGYGSSDVEGKYESITDEVLKSQDFATKLNNNKSKVTDISIPLATWIYNENSNPTFKERQKATLGNMSITNTKDPNKIYTVIVHHYLKNTTEQLDDDKEYSYKEGEHYKVTPSEDVLKDYDYYDVVGEEEKDVTQDEEITYYYTLKEHEIITRVEIPEGRAEKGGSITGEGETPYETVGQHKNSIKEIVATPDEGYTVKEIRLVSTDDDGNKVETIVYGNNSEETSEIKTRIYPDGSVKLTQFIDMTEDEEIIVVFEPDEGRVIIHHYIEGTTEKIHADEVTIDIIGKDVETSEVDHEKYKVVEKPNPQDTKIEKEVQELIYYYQEQYKITTDVIEHDETYKDRTEKDVKGGKVVHVTDQGDQTLEDDEVYEEVLKNRSNKETIKIVPDEGYEIVKITINGKDFDFKDYEEDGEVTLPEDFFKNMQEDKHIEVEFKKKSRVIVKYLEETTEKVLYTTDEGENHIVIEGLEGEEFKTSHKVFPSYNNSDLGITDENKDCIAMYDRVQITELNTAEGTMYADEITIIYWYTKIPSGVIERHIEINEKGETSELEKTLIPGYVSEKVTTNRKEYEGYIPVNGPDSESTDVVVAKENEKTKDVISEGNKVIEVWYYYEKQYNVTTEVKPHKEVVVNKETGKEETKLVEGGTISKEYEKDEQGNDKLDENGNKIETVYETVLSRGDSVKEIVITPDDGYRIKSVIKQKIVIDKDGNKTIVDEEIFIEDKIKEDGIVTLEKGILTDVQNDYNIVVEFERIPAKVIVKYKDAYTKESIQEDKIVDGFVYEEYTTAREEIESYITAEVDAVKDGNQVKADVTYNAEGNENTAYIETEEHYMTEDVITITYWYTKQFKITTDVKEHEEEDSEGNKVSVKGGEISGEDETPYEAVTRGEDSTKEITMKPEEGYRIKRLTINGTEIEIKDLIKEDGSITIPLFENMQEDKHIEVEFERIPAKVIVEHFDEETNEPIVDNETLDGYVDKDYETEPKDLQYYELVEEKYPENDKGTMAKEDITVRYYYKKLKFNMRLEKEISKITINGNDIMAQLENNKSAKVEVEYRDLDNTNIEVSYKIKVTNTEKVVGTSVIEENIPEGFEFVIELSNANWIAQDGRYILQTEEIAPGETKEYEVTLRWNAKYENKGQRINIAKITQTNNIPNFKETTLEDNEDTAMVEVIVNKKLGDVIDNIKDGKVDEVIKDIVTDIKSVKTGDAIMMSIAALAIAGATIIIITKLRKVEKHSNKGKHRG